MPLPLLDAVRARLRGHDLPLCAAGVTFYGTIGVVPLALVGTRLAAAAVGEAEVRRQVRGAAELVPGLGEHAVLLLGDAGTRMPWLAVLAAVLPAGLYGEGLVRAFARLAPQDVHQRALRGRLVSAVALLLAPAVVGVVLLAAGHLRVDSPVLGTYLAFLVTWVLASGALALAYRFLTPASPSGTALLWSAAGTGSFVAGFGLGFLLFLSLDVPIGAAYGGATALATAAIAVLWLQGLHLLGLVGYALALSLDARGARDRSAASPSRRGSRHPSGER